MTSDTNRQRVSLLALLASLLIVTAIFGVRAEYTPLVSYTLAAVQIIAISVFAWRLGGCEILSADRERRQLALAGILLVTPWLLFALLAGYGRPDEASHAENQIRYLVLLFNSIAVAGGLVLLRQSLVDARERMFSSLGFVAVLLATSLYTIWAALLHELHHTLAFMSKGEIPAWFKALADLSDTLLFFGGFLTYLATTAFATSLEHVEWLGKKTARMLKFVSLFAIVCLAFRGLLFPDPALVFTRWYLIPGWVAGIPAIPWIMPCLIGVIMLKRAGKVD